MMMAITYRTQIMLHLCINVLLYQSAHLLVIRPLQRKHCYYFHFVAEKTDTVMFINTQDLKSWTRLRDNRFNFQDLIMEPKETVIKNQAVWVHNRPSGVIF